MKLNKSQVIFRESDHTYWLGSTQLKGTSHLYGRHINSLKYDGISPDILQKAAERGTRVHEDCEAYDRFGLIGSKEAENWAKMREKESIGVIENEYLVSDNVFFATKIDKVMIVGEPEENMIDLGDVKTTSELDLDSLSWQLSVSAELFEKQNPHLKVRNLYGIWLRGDKKKIVPVSRKPTSQVISLMDAEQFGLPFILETEQLPEELNDTLRKVSELETFIQEQTEQLEQKKSDMDVLKAYLIEQMSGKGIKKLEGEKVVVTYVEAYSKELFDSKKFKQEQPELAKKYIKQTQVKETIKIKLKCINNN